MMQERLVIGVCAMDSKARSKSMRNILSRLLEDSRFEVVNFGDHVILEEPISQWPRCDILIAFFSHGFPLQKAIQYAALTRPYLINDLLMQELLLDRRTVLAILEAIDVPCPRRMMINKDKPSLSQELLRLASRDFGIDLGQKSSLFKESKVIVHADAIELKGMVMRKPFVEKPADAENHNIHIYYPNGRGGRRLFRKVENKSSEHDSTLSCIRNDGKSYIYEEFIAMDNAEDVKVYTIGPYHAYAETRKSPSITGVVKRNPEGKEIRKETVLSEEEQDIARRICMAFGQTICGFDMLRVNGKSYVIDVNGWSFVKGSPSYDDLCAKVLAKILSQVMNASPITRLRKPSGDEGDQMASQWKLKCYVNVLRHADRTPKLKYKINIKGTEFEDLDTIPTPQGKLEYILRSAEGYKQDLHNDNDRFRKMAMLVEILRQKIHHPSTKAQTRPLKDGTRLLIIKWGGEFTHAGRHQARELGETIRKDLQILNKESLNNVKICCSVERRVQATADVFTKGFFKIAEAPPNTIQIRSDLLDQASAAKASLESVKSQIGFQLNEDRGPGHLNVKSLIEIFLSSLHSMRDKLISSYERISLFEMFQYRWCCCESPTLFKERWDKHFRDILEALHIDPARVSDFYDSLKYDAVHHREFLECIFGEIEHNDLLKTVYSTTQQIFAYLSPKEAGLTPTEKLKVGLQMIRPLLRDIIAELNVAQTEGSSRCRFYFTKESHMVALLNVIVHSGITLSRRRVNSVLFPESLTEDIYWFGELDYLSQICFELYEKRKIDVETNIPYNAYSLRIGVSQGAHDPHLLDLQLDQRHYLSVSPKKWITAYLNSHETIAILSKLAQ